MFNTVRSMVRFIFWLTVAAVIIGAGILERYLFHTGELFGWVLFIVVVLALASIPKVRNGNHERN